MGGTEGETGQPLGVICCFVTCKIVSVTANNYLARITFATLSSTLDNPSIDLSYLASDASTDATDLANKIVIGLNNTPTGGTHSISAYLAPSISRGANSATVRVYNVTGHLDGSPHGSPASSMVFTPTAPITGLSLPEGVCCCVTNVASYGSDVEFGPVSAIPTPPDLIADFGAASTHQGRTRPRSRDRGRQYWGPLNLNVIGNESTTNRALFGSSFLTDMGLAYAQFLNAPALSGSGTTAKIQVWSRRNVSMKPVAQVVIADRPAYQRRRVDQSVLHVTTTMP